MQKKLFAQNLKENDSIQEFENNFKNQDGVRSNQFDKIKQFLDSLPFERTPIMTIQNFPIKEVKLNKQPSQSIKPKKAEIKYLTYMKQLLDHEILNKPGAEKFKKFLKKNRQDFFGYDYDSIVWEQNFKGTPIQLQIQRSLFNFRACDILLNAINTKYDNEEIREKKIKQLMKIADKYYEDQLAKVDKEIRNHVKKKFDYGKSRLLVELQRIFLKTQSGF